MEKGYKPSDYSDYDNLVYFRWKALIRSQEYKKFYRENDIKALIEEKDSIDSAISNIERDFSYFEWEFDGYTPGPTPSIHELKEADYVNSETREELNDLLSEKETLDERENDLFFEAEERFGLIADDLADLKPVDKSIGSLVITFMDYLPAKPGRFYKNLAVQEVEYIDGNFFIVGDNKIKRKLIPATNQKLFSINTNTPFSLIAKSFEEKLEKCVKKNLQKRSDRKDFKKWEEAFRVWDVNRKKRNTYKTAHHLRWTTKKNRKGEKYSKEELRTLVTKKLEVANDLIDLAGRGKFKSL